MINILVCEDDENIRNLICEYLKRDRYQVFESENGKSALDILDKTHIDLLITDIMMPCMDGYTLTKDLRDAGYGLPILIITAKETTQDKREGFSLGADDYMVKPIDMDEMLMRVSALLRRVKIFNEKRLVIGSTVFNYDCFTVNDVEIPKKEFMLVYKLLSSNGKILTRTQLMDEIWGYDSESDIRTVDVHIKRLREKFQDNADFGIVTVKGIGYKAVKI